MNKHEYINDYLYFVMRPDTNSDSGAVYFCSGVNLDRFMPLMKMRCGIGNNPILNGLKVINFDICSRETSKGAGFKVIDRGGCTGIAPTKDTWYTQQMRIEDPSALSLDDIIDYAVKSLLARIATFSPIPVQLPDKTATPGELQDYLDTLCAAIPATKAA